jgi:hypothetical protein
MKIFTYRHLEWSKRASSLASLLDDALVDPTKELNLHMMGKSRSGATPTPTDQVAVIELLVPSIFRAMVLLHPAGSTFFQSPNPSIRRHNSRTTTHAPHTPHTLARELNLNASTKPRH